MGCFLWWVNKVTCTFQHRAFPLCHLFCFSIFYFLAFNTVCAINPPTEHVKSPHCDQWSRCSPFRWPWGTGTTFSCHFPCGWQSDDVFYPTLIVLPHWCCNFLFSKTLKLFIPWCSGVPNVNSYLMVQDKVILFPLLPITVWFISFPENWYEQKRAAWGKGNLTGPG